MAKLQLTNFSKGEFAPELYGRTDIPQYNAGVRQGRNFIIQRYGGVAARPGFRFAGEVDDKTKGYRMMPFLFSNDQAYVHLLGDLQLRVLAKGGFVVDTNLKISAITKAVNGQITSQFHGLSVGDRLYLDGIVGMAELNGRFVTVMSVPDANNFTIDVDTTNFGTFVSSDGTFNAGPPPAPPPPPAPLPPPPAPTPPPPTGGGGGTGGGTGGGSGGWTKYYPVSNV